LTWKSADVSFQRRPYQKLRRVQPGSVEKDWIKNDSLNYLPFNNISSVPTANPSGQVESWLKGFALTRTSPVALGKNIPLQRIGILKRHRQFGAHQTGQDILEDDLDAWRVRFWVK
jgi:hypothetical protein